MKKIMLMAGLFLLSFTMAACNAPSVDLPTPTGQPDESPTAPVLPTDALPEPGQPEFRSLIICLGQEPNTLYPYGGSNLAARSVQAAIYDGPIDIFLDGYQPVILETIPTLQNDDVEVVPVSASRGDLIVNTDDQVVLLDAGVNYYPAGCNDPSCAQRYSGSGQVEMDQMVVTYRLLPDVLWSDGQPVTAEDSVFAFRIASDPETPVSKYKIDRTQIYEVVDDVTVQWWGRPGFIDPTYPENFWSPLPFHAWSGYPAAELARAEAESRPPLGWGPYVFESWVRGESIRLVKNPNYFRAEEDLPAFDALTFRFLRDGESGISALGAGECDLLDSSLRLDSQLELLLEMESSGLLKVSVTETNLMERLDFGLQPASYDDGLGISDRPNLFGDVRTRQAIAYCLNRQGVVDQVFSGLTYVPTSFIPMAHSAYSTDTASYPFDPNQGIALLEQAGWLDTDENPATPRVSSGVTGLPDGVSLQLNYQTSSALQRRQAAEILAASLGECGIGVNVEHLSVNDLYAPGPEGPLFGRQFDLAVYAIGQSGLEPACFAYAADEIPAAGNDWLGVNIMGYRNADFDSLCQQARRSLPEQPAYQANYARLQSIFANDLPSIPLYARLKLAAMRPDMCNFALQPNLLFDFWNLEEWDVNPACRLP